MAELIKSFAGELTEYLLCFWTILILFSSFNLELFICFLVAVKTNDMMLVIYLSSLIRSVIALHNLINNKVFLFSCFFFLIVIFLFFYAGFLLPPLRNCSLLYHRDAMFLADVVSKNLIMN